MDLQTDIPGEQPPIQNVKIPELQVPTSNTSTSSEAISTRKQNTLSTQIQKLWNTIKRRDTEYANSGFHRLPKKDLLETDEILKLLRQYTHEYTVPQQEKLVTTLLDMAIASGVKTGQQLHDFCGRPSTFKLLLLPINSKSLEDMTLTPEERQKIRIEIDKNIEFNQQMTDLIVRLFKGEKKKK